MPSPLRVAVDVTFVFFLGVNLAPAQTGPLTAPTVLALLAACAPSGSPGNDVITCNGHDTTGVSSDTGDDAVDVLPGATIAVSALGLTPGATAISTGDGLDIVTNAGTITSDTTAVLSPVLTPPSPLPGLSLLWGAAVTAAPDATGVDAGSGADTITNASTGSIAPTATAVLLPSVVPGVVEGVSHADVSSTARAVATAIAGGPGQDLIANHGLLSPFASAFALGVNVAIASVREDDKDGKSTVKGNVKAEAGASGVSGGDDNDTITNTGTIGAAASATASTASASVTEVKGSATVKATSASNATATGIDAGAGNDTISNTGEITAAADSTAVALNVAVGTKDDSSTQKPEKLKSAVEGGATATAAATGIAADGHATTTERELAFLNDGVTTTLIVQQLKTPPSGDDTVTNAGSTTAIASSMAGAAGVGMIIDGATAAKVTSKAEATATAVDLGGGNDSLLNTSAGTLTAAADATAAALNAAFGTKTDPAEKGDVKAAADGSARATAHATGITGDSSAPSLTHTVALSAGDGVHLQVTEVTTRAGGSDSVSNSGVIDASATATTLAAGVGVVADGNASARVTSTAEAIAAGIDTGAGNDVLANLLTGEILATAISTAGALNAAIGARSDSSATSEIEAVAEGSATATARATGLAADSVATDRIRGITASVDDGVSLVLQDDRIRTSGNDAVNNDGKVTAAASATTAAVGAAIAVDGKATAKITSTAEATAAAVDLGGGNDSATNTGELTAITHATADALNAAVGAKTDTTDKSKVEAAVEGSATAKARSTGLTADGLAGDTTQAASLSVGNGTVTLRVASNDTRAAGDDLVTNTGAITSTATSLTSATGVGIAVDAKAAAKATSTAEADASGIDLGGGSDTLTNSGTIAANATSTATAINLAIGISGDSSSTASKSTSSVDGSASAQARATGISSDALVGDTATSLELTLNAEGLRAAYLKRETRSSGDDTVTNSGTIDASATAMSGSGGGGITVKGSASANTKSTAEAAAVALALGGGQDVVVNTGALTADALGASGALAAAVSTEGRAFSSDGLWQGGIKARADATGIDAVGVREQSTLADLLLSGSGILASYETIKDGMGAAGSAFVRNTANITAGATAIAGTVNVAVSADGKAAAISHVEGTANAAGIRTGHGDDTIENVGAGILSVASSALASAGTVAVSGKGAAVAADALWDSGIKAEAVATGINADGGTLVTDLITAAIDFNGLRSDVEVTRQVTTMASSGNDTIVNEQTLDVAAAASTPALAAAIEAKKGLAATISSVRSEATATGIRGGGGDDDVTNRGAVTSRAMATAETTNVAVAQQGVAAASGSVWDGGTRAEATAIGIDADGGVIRKETTTTLTASLTDGGTITHQTTVENARGNDVVTNEGSLTTTAIASASALDVALTTKGLSAALSQSTAVALAEAIRGGDGDDHLTNRGALTSTADATASAASVAVTTDAGVSVAGNAVWDGGVTADATAIGIRGDGGDRSSTSTLTLRTAGTDRIDRDAASEAARGNDVILNSGQIDAIATGTAPSVSVAIGVSGVAGAVSTSTARANAAAIDAGGGDDQVTNTGTLNAEATSLAVAVNGSGVNKGVAIAANDSWDGGVNAESRARGIDGGAGFDTITNTGEIAARSWATAPSVSAAVAITGVPVAVSTATATSSATAIDAGGGVEADWIVNLAGIGAGQTGKLTAHAEALAATANVAVTNSGAAVAADAVWDGGTGAVATAKGIDAGLGADTITNAAEIESTADATAASASVAVAVSGVAGAIATSSAHASAIAIDAGFGQDADVVTNTGKLLAEAVARAFAASVGVTTAGVAVAADSVWDGGTTAETVATGISTGGGDDVVTNAGEIGAVAEATTGGAAVSVAVSGVAGAIATSTARAQATAIDTGAGSGADDITNTGALNASSRSLAGTVTVGVTTAGVAVAGDAAWNGGTTGDARATGIAAGGGADVIRNEGDITSASDAKTASAAVSVAVSGVAGAVGTSTAISNATAIDAGAGDDTVINSDGRVAGRSGKLSAQADALATAATVTVTTAGVAVSSDAVWDGGTTASATARGIDGGLGADSIRNASEIDARGSANTASAAVAVAISGVAGALAGSTSTSAATAIDAGADVDANVIDNTGKLVADAHALAISAAIGFTTAGVAVAGNATWDGGTLADAVARGIAGGLGIDTIDNAARIDATSTAHADSVAGSVAVFGVSGALSTATANAGATAIDAGSGDDLIRNAATGDLEAEAKATGVAVNVAITGGGVAAAADSVWDGGTRATATAAGIGGGLGRDTIVNDAVIAAMADSTTVSTAVSLTGIGAGGAISTSTSTATATAIDGGDDADAMWNTGNLTSLARSIATGVAVTVSGLGVAVAGDAFWNGGTSATANASGITGGAGHDAIVNQAELITADAESTTRSVAISVTGAGLSGAAAGSTSTARAAAIDGNEGDDTITTTGDVISRTLATASGVSVAITAAGGAVTGALLDNVTRADATALGIVGGTGSDIITATETSSITLTSGAESSDTGVAVALGGPGFAAADSRALVTAAGTGIQGGDGSDMLENRGSIAGTLNADLKARTVSVGFSSAEGTASGTATSVGIGMDGGAGEDVVTNIGAIGLSAISKAFGQAVSATLADSAVSDAGATSESLATGLAGGAGDDTLANLGTIDAAASSTTTARSIGVVGLGMSLNKVNSSADATAIGADGGSGADHISNALGAALAVHASATTIANDVSVGVAGYATGEAMTTPLARAVGLEGGAGGDVVVNDGTIDVTAAATATSSNTTVTVAGAAGTQAGTEAQATATGLGGGDGDDMLLNRGVLTIGTTSNATVNGSSWTLAGVAADTAALTAVGTSTGIAGGLGAEWMRNEGTMAVTAASTLVATGSPSKAIFGNATSNAQLTANSLAIGMAGGEDVNTIENAGSIDVAATADVRSTRASVSFAGAPESAALLVARARTTGIGGGSAADSIRNEGSLTINALSTSTVSGGARTTFGGTTAGGHGTSEAIASGLDGAGGANLVVNTGGLNVGAEADGVVTNDSKSGWLVGGADTRADAAATVLASGLLGGSGDNRLRNDGDVQVVAQGTGYGFASASGAHLSFAADGTAAAESRALTTAAGIAAGDGRNLIVNTGRLFVSSLASTVRNLTTTTNVCSQEIVPVEECHQEEINGEMVTVCVQTDEIITTCEDKEVVVASNPTYAGANGNGVAGDGRALATGTATAHAYGLQAGDGDNTIVNTGEIHATASPDARTRAFADGDALGDAIGTARATANAGAWGIRAGDGNNHITNSGSLTVLADPTAQAQTEVTGGDICITFLFWTWCGGGGTGTGTANAAFDARAVGIIAGDGDNTVINEGSISVSSAPEVAGFTARVNSEADRSTVTTSVAANAVGIQTGNGNSAIHNAATGTIDVSVHASSACNGACTSSLAVTGILTGTGNDLIVNDGSISTSIVSASGAVGRGVAISAGAGDDTVVLGVGATTIGRVLLGTGNDTLVWSANASLSDTAEAEAGTDTFALGGSVDADFSLSLLGQTFNGFELFQKRGASTWTLVGDRRIDWNVREGALAVAGTITGTFDTHAGTPGATIAVLPVGTLRADGVVAAVVLNGQSTLLNEGVVEAIGAGVAVSAPGSANHIDNRGVIRSGSTAIEVSGDGNLVSNTGTVLGTGTTGAAVLLAGGDNTLVNDGAIVGPEAAVSATGQGTLIINRGTVTASGAALHLSGSGNTVMNAGLVSGTGAAGTGVAMAGQGHLLSNLGTILGTGTAAVRFDSAPGTTGSVVNEAGGTITGLAGVAIQGGAGDERIANHGTIAGAAGVALDLGGGADELLVSATSAIGGMARGGAGIDTFILGGTQDAAFDLSGIGPHVNGFEVFRKQGSATWTLFGTGTADWTLDEHTLAIEGKLTGTVLSSPTASNALIDVRSTGTVSRHDDGAAVVLNGGAQLNNDGLIDSTGDGGHAVQAHGAGNWLTNAGAVRSAGIGFDISGDGNLLTNAGNILAVRGGISTHGTNNTIFNEGQIEVTGGGTAVQTEGHENLFTNFATVRSAGVGLRFSGNGNVLTNVGFIDTVGTAVHVAGHGSQVLNQGELNAHGIALEVAGSGNVIDNAGLIQGGATGIVTRGDTALTNRGAVVSEGTGIVMEGSGMTLQNSGQVLADGTAVRIDSAPGGTSSVVNGIGAWLQGVGGPAVRGGAGSDRLENHGVLLGGDGTSVDLAGGDDVLHLTTTALLQGTARGGSGTDTLVLAGTGAARTDLGMFVDFETLEKQDASLWILIGAADMTWALNAGHLAVEGTLSGAGIVRAGSLLSGGGSVGGFVNHGTVAPGSSIGTLRVLGDYEQATGGILEIETAINGASDVLQISGRALLSGGGLAVFPETRPYGIATAFTILDADGGITGSFGSANSSLAYLDPVLDYDPQKVRLTLIRNDVSFGGMGTTANTRALGSALDADKKSMAHGDFKGLMDQFLLMDPDQQRGALQSLSGELHATTMRSLLHTGARFFSATLERQPSAHRVEGTRKTVWTDAFGFTGSLDGDNNAAGASYRATSFAGGMDVHLGDATRIGGALAFSPGRTRLGVDSARTRSLQPAIYGRHDANRWSLGLGVGYGRHDIQSTRGIVVGPISRQAAADYRADQYSGQISGAVTLVRTQPVSLQAIGELRYSQLIRPAFGESGADSASLTSMSEARSESLRSVLGMRTSWTPRLGALALRPELKLGWARESLDHQGELTATLMGATALPGFQRFTVHGANEARDSAVFSVGATTAFVKRGRAFVLYDGIFNGSRTEHGFGVGAQIHW